MTTATDAVLAYGYDLGSGDGGWQLEGVGQWGAWEPSWYEGDAADDSDSEIAEAANARLKAAGSAVALVPYVCSSNPSYFLTDAWLTASRGETVDASASVQSLRVNVADAALADACKLLDIQPTGARRWWLASDTDLY